MAGFPLSPFQFVHQLEVHWHRAVGQLDSPYRKLETRRIINGFKDTASLQFYDEAQDDGVELVCAVDVESAPQRGSETPALKYRFFSDTHGTSPYRLAMPEDMNRLAREGAVAANALCSFLGITREEAKEQANDSPEGQPAETETHPTGPRKDFDVDKLVISKLAVDPNLGGIQPSDQEEEGEEPTSEEPQEET